ncbi:hypothetical protein Ddye_004794 [Dipteronia dyeriana]|uniref:Uncharacterized protein n=1 Tax=Dipteronia dyeriana TaxID=168575 RepID=A0AAD9XEY6_9ROSI|nr:hypothetical protein Ddye_004794 [Dipteronia dyeriana]
MIDYVGGYAMAEEEQIAHGGEFIHGGCPVNNQKSQESVRKTMVKVTRRVTEKKGKTGEKMMIEHGGIQGASIPTIPSSQKPRGNPKYNRRQKPIQKPLRQSNFAKRDTTKDYIEKLIREGPTKGFGGTEIRVSGTVKLPVEAGSFPCTKTVLLDFVVINIENWPYNALLGGPFLNNVKALTATYMLMVKFLTEAGIGIMKSSQKWARKTQERQRQRVTKARRNQLWKFPLAMIIRRKLSGWGPN